MLEIRITISILYSKQSARIPFYPPSNTPKRLVKHPTPIPTLRLIREHHNECKTYIGIVKKRRVGHGELVLTKMVNFHGQRISRAGGIYYQNLQESSDMSDSLMTSEHSRVCNIALAQGRNIKKSEQR